MPKNSLTKAATCVLLSVPIALVLGAWRAFSATGGTREEVVALLVAGGVVVGLVLMATPFWRVQDKRTSRILLVCASLLAALSHVLRPTINSQMARAVGLFDEPQAWAGAIPEDVAGQRFKHPLGGYSLRIPDGWTAHKESTGQTSFRFEQDARLVAEIFPSCWSEDDVVEFAARRMADGSQDAWSCTMMGGLEACRFEHSPADGHGAAVGQVEILLQRPHDDRGARLMYRTYQQHDEAALAQVAASVVIEEGPGSVSCPVPTTWAIF